MRDSTRALRPMSANRIGVAASIAFTPSIPSPEWAARPFTVTSTSTLPKQPAHAPEAPPPQPRGCRAVEAQHMTFDQTQLRKITHARKFASFLIGAKQE